jgi:hypothetical protein
VGTIVVGLTSITSIVNGNNVGLFSVVALLTNAAWLLGSLVVAVSLIRAGTVPAAGGHHRDPAVQHSVPRGCDRAGVRWQV